MHFSFSDQPGHPQAKCLQCLQLDAYEEVRVELLKLNTSVYDLCDVKYQLDEADDNNHRAKLKIRTECILPQVKERLVSRMLRWQWVLTRHEAEKVLLRTRIVSPVVLSILLLLPGFSQPGIVQVMNVRHNSIKI